MDLCCNLSSVISWVIKRLSVVSYFNPINCIVFNFLSILWRIIIHLKEKSKKYEKWLIQFRYDDNKDSFLVPFSSLVNLFLAF